MRSFLQSQCLCGSCQPQSCHFSRFALSQLTDSHLLVGTFLPFSLTLSQSIVIAVSESGRVTVSWCCCVMVVCSLPSPNSVHVTDVRFVTGDRSLLSLTSVHVTYGWSCCNRSSLSTVSDFGLCHRQAALLPSDVGSLLSLFSVHVIGKSFVTPI